MKSGECCIVLPSQEGTTQAGLTVSTRSQHWNERSAHIASPRWPGPQFQEMYWLSSSFWRIRQDAHFVTASIFFMILFNCYWNRILLDVANSKEICKVSLDIWMRFSQSDQPPRNRPAQANPPASPSLSQPARRPFSQAHTEIWWSSFSTFSENDGLQVCSMRSFYTWTCIIW